MAVTINNFWGAETGGLEEVDTSGGTAAASTVQVHSGTYSYVVSIPADIFRLDPFEVISDAGTKCILGLWYRTGPDSNTVINSIVNLTDLTNSDFFVKYRGSTGRVTLYDSTNTQRLSSFVLDINTWYFIEVYVDRVDSGGAELFIDGASQGTTSARDFNAITGTPVLEFRGTANGIEYIDDIYFISGAAAAVDRLGGCEVFSYRSNKTGATPDTGDNLNAGAWANTQEVPFSDTVAGAYTATTALAGHIITDDVGGSSGGGPDTDTNITGPIAAIKGIWLARRDNGTATDHFGLLGNSGDGVTRTPELGLTQSNAIYTFVSESASIVPTDSEFCRIGIEKTSGGRIFNCREMLAVILHVPPAVSLDTSLIHAQGSKYTPFLMR